ncbi:MAG: aminopeptidase P family protein [Pseudomonadota bacterium]
MFQDFTAKTDPSDGPPRLAKVRRAMADRGIDATLVPRADAHQGEYVAPCDERLAWLTGFTGSAGFVAVTSTQAGLFVDGRYRVQGRAQAAAEFDIVPWPETGLAAWLGERLAAGAIVGFDPWLHTTKEIEALGKALESKGIALKPVAPIIDEIWADRPTRPTALVRAHPKTLAGVGDETKRGEVAKTLADAGHSAAVLTLPDSICWLLNIRGGDIKRIPLVQAFAILHADASIELFSDVEKFAELGPDPAITLLDWSAFGTRLAALEGPVRVDPASAPFAVTDCLRTAGVEVAAAQDPCVLPKAQKNPVELDGTRAAHLRDAAAMVEFLAWLDAEAPKGGLTEIDVVKALEEKRRATGTLKDISFDTICGAGENGAIVHYRVTEATNAPVTPGDLLLVDSGGQYEDGTTDITRTIAIGTPEPIHRRAFTRVLQGMIAISRARWPAGLAGRDLDALARAPLWSEGWDYNHGTGHGVGVYLGVHEGPQNLSKRSHQALLPGMIVSNEPGYYREGAFGIRIENLVIVVEATALADADDRAHLEMETLTWVPIDLRLVDRDLMSAVERDWLNAYHVAVREKISPRVSETARQWLDKATAAL